MKSAHRDRTAETRNAIMAAAERLFAEHGLFTVSHRQIAEAALQRNNTAVGYHFGGKTDLVRAIMTRNGEQIDQLRRRHLAVIEGSQDIRDWVGALVRPATEHLDSLGTSSWNARMTVQVMADPTMRDLVSEEACSRPYLRQVLDGLGRCLADVPAAVRVERGTMSRHLITHTCAERERALARDDGPLHDTWERTADALTDAIVGLLTAPVTSTRT